jgi:hypothetical protein
MFSYSGTVTDVDRHLLLSRHQSSRPPLPHLSLALKPAISFSDTPIEIIIMHIVYCHQYNPESNLYLSSVCLLESRLAVRTYSNNIGKAGKPEKGNVGNFVNGNRRE